MNESNLENQEATRPMNVEADLRNPIDHLFHPKHKTLPDVLFLSMSHSDESYESEVMSHTSCSEQSAITAKKCLLGIPIKSNSSRIKVSNVAGS